MCFDLADDSASRVHAIQFSAMNSKRLLAFTLALVLLSSSGCTMWGEKKHSTWNSATSGEQVENLFWKEVQAKRWSEVEAHVAPGFVGTSPSRTVDRAGMMEHLRQVEITAFQIGEVKTQSAGADLIVTYEMTVNGTVGGKPFPATPLRMMSVWQELKNGWAMVAHTTVPSEE